LHFEENEKMKNNPFELLKKDHREVARLLAILERTTEDEVKKREEIFRELKQSLDDHADIEESILYPTLKLEAETHALSLEAVEEHQIVKDLLEEMRELPTGNDEWTAKLTVLKENIEHHVDEEENEMFPKAEDALSEEAMNHLGERIFTAQTAAEEARTY
jgi:hemerythrin-like domain-containing protein